MRGIWANGDAREFFYRGKVVGFAGENAVLFGGETQSEGPEGVFDVGIAVTSIDEHGTGSVGEKTDAALRNAILVVGINPTERDGLVGVGNSRPKLLGGKDSVVAVVVLHGDIVVKGEAFESEFGGDSIVAGGGFLGVDVVQARSVVNEDSGHKVAFVHEFAGGLGHKPWRLGDELVDGHNVSWFKVGRGQMACVVGRAPGLPFGFAEEAPGAFGNVAVSNADGKDALLGGLLEAVEGQVPILEMVAHEEVSGLGLRGDRRG
jgi:hypothetical protein